MARAIAAQSWQVTAAAYRTPALAVVILVVVIGIAEITTRTAAVRDVLHIPSVGSSSRRFELQLDGLARYAARKGGIDCLILGNSTALMGVDPEALGRSYRGATGETLRCFNFGVAGMTASAAGAVAPILVRRYRPRLLIYVVSVRDVGKSVEGPLLAADAWVRYQHGTFSVPGWLASHSAAFGYYLLYRQWLDPLRWPAARSPSGTTATGFFATTAHLSLSPALWAHTQQSYGHILDQPLSQPELTGFSRLLSLSGDDVQVVVVEAPAHPRLRRWAHRASTFYSNAITHLRHAARVRHVAFWRAPTQRIIPPDSWVDFVHLDAHGAARFSEWLGARLARTVGTGRLVLPDAALPKT
jgi:hypothetical protein